MATIASAAGEWGRVGGQAVTVRKLRAIKRNGFRPGNRFGRRCKPAVAQPEPTITDFRW